MSDIKWKDGAVCYGDGRQWFANTNYDSDKLELVNNDGTRKYSLYGILNYPNDFQLNEIREGDFIAASELETEQKYNDVVEVFGLFGAEDAIGYKGFTLEFCNLLLDGEYGIVAASNGVKSLTRQLTYSQIIAIGKIKRMMLERAIPAVEFEVVEDELIDHQTLGNRVTTNKYEREITDRQGNIATVDVYDVLKAFDVTCPATQHAVKKLLCSGLRGHKDLQTDLIEAKESIVRAIELN